MAKFYGEIGFSTTSETAPGVFTETVIEKRYSGDVLQNTRRWEAGEGLNDNLNISNMLSIVANSFAYQNIYAMKYIRWMGVLWKITKVEIQRPRLILTIGGVYHA